MVVVVAAAAEWIGPNDRNWFGIQTLQGPILHLVLLLLLLLLNLMISGSHRAAALVIDGIIRWWISTVANIIITTSNI